MPGAGRAPKMAVEPRKGEAMTTSVGINGFGRVGRCAFRSAFERGLDIDWVGINDLADAPTLAHLLRHDSVYGPFPGAIELDGDALGVEGRRIPILSVGE